ncbi:E3 SUMO-protein ligase pias2 [Cichlidogyrus casuarinus]|uniref:E3 SUMO-protein ligase pias2 n=1 Tax=Cichlidogyrus casuarinus TaxID=1844966 RepID=A0ABD2QL00_9PLAT
MPANANVVVPQVFSALEFNSTPFYVLVETLVKPTILIPHIGNFLPDARKMYSQTYPIPYQTDVFETIAYHTKNLPNMQTYFGVEVVLRFAKFDQEVAKKVLKPPLNHDGYNESALLEVEDALPTHLTIEINGRSPKMPHILPSSKPTLDGRRNPRPISVTSLLKLARNFKNTVKISWMHDYSSYVYHIMGIYLMQKRSVSELCNSLSQTSVLSLEECKKAVTDKLASKKPVQKCDESPELQICELQADDDLILPTTISVQLVCPLSKSRISLPVRASTCSHIQCFDATSYLLLNSNKPTWLCPVCDGPAPYSLLLVDQVIMDALKQESTSNTDTIIFNQNGEWTPGEPNITDVDTDEETLDIATSQSRKRPVSPPLDSSSKRGLFSLHNLYSSVSRDDINR